MLRGKTTRLMRRVVPCALGLLLLIALAAEAKKRHPSLVVEDDYRQALADLSMGMMALVNLVAISLLSGIAFKILKDYNDQLEHHEEPVFRRERFPELDAHLHRDVWD